MRYGGNTLPDMEGRTFLRLVRGFGQVDTIRG